MTTGGGEEFQNIDVGAIISTLGKFQKDQS